MVKEGNELVLMLLRKAVEEKSGFKATTSNDFERLAETITDSGSGYISSSTLKRLWGYVKDTRGKHKATLDVLARYAGFPRGYTELEQDVTCKANIESGYDSKRVLDLLTVEPDTMIQLDWLPDRSVVLRCLGDCVLQVTESHNAKLKVGMKVRCPRIVDGEKLIVDLITPDQKKSLVYEAGKTNGVTWHLLD